MRVYLLFRIGEWCRKCTFKYAENETIARCSIVNDNNSNSRFICIFCYSLSLYTFFFFTSFE
jgi:hypothetical protein